MALVGVRLTAQLGWWLWPGLSMAITYLAAFFTAAFFAGALFTAAFFAKNRPPTVLVVGLLPCWVQ